MDEIVELLIKKNKTISTMESCTGGAIASCITDIPNASKVMMFSAVTYSNLYKIKMGVAEELINKYTVYSMEVANEMAKVISDYTKASFGIGVTGKLKKIDENNLYGADDIVYLSIYERDTNTYYNEKIKLSFDTRKENKKQIIDVLINKMQEILKKQ